MPPAAGGTVERPPEQPSFEAVAERLEENHATAADLLQETLVKISRGLGTFEGRSSVKTWAFSAAARVATDHSRRPESKAPIVEYDEVEKLPAAGVEVEEQLVVEEMSACVREVIDSLPGDYRTAMVLHDLEGLTAAEVAEVAGCSPVTAKIRINRGRQRLQAALEDDCRFYRDKNNVFRCDREPPSQAARPYPPVLSFDASERARCPVVG